MYLLQQITVIQIVYSFHNILSLNFRMTTNRSVE
jgi:hypothetical protein